MFEKEFIKMLIEYMENSEKYPAIKESLELWEDPYIFVDEVKLLLEGMK